MGQTEPKATLKVETQATTGKLLSCPDPIHKASDQDRIDRRYLPCQTCKGTTNNPEEVEETVPLTFNVEYYGTLTVMFGDHTLRVNAVQAEMLGTAIAIRNGAVPRR